MELKKSKKADLERKKGVFFQVGILVALLVVFLAFEYVGAREKSVLYQLMGGETLPEEVVIVVPPDVTPPPPPPPPTMGELKPVDNNTPADNLPPFDPTDLSRPDYPFYYADTVVDIPPPPERPDVIIDIPDINPEFIGGEAARLKFLSDNVKYPRAAIEMGVEGKVIVGFVVEKDGSITDVKVLRSASPLLDQEAVRVAKLMPKWQAGLQKGKAVRAKFNMPITFNLKGN